MDTRQVALSAPGYFYAEDGDGVMFEIRSGEINNAFPICRASGAAVSGSNANRIECPMCGKVCAVTPSKRLWYHYEAGKNGNDHRISQQRR